jgi:catechol 2,3-dioxygenase-like lactoylglutathione lyase family enzyme
MHPYVTIGALDVAAAHRFYDAVLATIGWSSHATYGAWRAYSFGGSGDGFVVWVCRPFDGAPASAGNGMMVGLPARSRADVDAFHAAVLAQGGTDEGAPGNRPDYGPNWYGAYVRDLTGNKLACYVNG